MATRSAGAAVHFIDPIALQRIRSLELVAHTVVDGFITGLHRSPYLGFSTDFAEHRPYMPGDDIRHIDWRLYARTDRYYLKLFEAETNANFAVLLDVSGSMQFGTKGITKIEYGKILAASLAYFSSRQRDRIGLFTFRDQVVDYVPPSAKHLDTVLHTIQDVQPKGSGLLQPPLERAANLLKRSGIAVLISDLYEDPDTVMGAVNQLRFSGQDVIVFHLLDPAELTFDYDDPSSFEDLESGERLPIVPEKHRQRYHGLIEDHVAALSDGFARNRVDYVLVDISQPLDRVLFDYLLARHRKLQTR